MNIKTFVNSYYYCECFFLSVKTLTWWQCSVWRGNTCPAGQGLEQVQEGDRHAGHLETTRQRSGQQNQTKIFEK